MKIRTVLMAGALVLMTGAASAPQDVREAPPGEGVFCAMAIFGAIAEIGRRCYPDRLPEFQEELRQSLARMDAYVLANSDITLVDLERFKADQTGAGMPDAELCSSDFASIYTETPSAEMTDAVEFGPTWISWSPVLARRHGERVSRRSVRESRQRPIYPPCPPASPVSTAAP